jgi:hypothetical protein
MLASRDTTSPLGPSAMYFAPPYQLATRGRSGAAKRRRDYLDDLVGKRGPSNRHAIIWT